MAVALLLLEAAHRDDRFDPEERAVIERLLTERFALSQQECGELMATCEAKQAGMVQLFPVRERSSRICPPQSVSR